MAESTTRFKDLTAKMDTILAVMDQHEERIIKLLEQSFATIFKYIENHKAQSSNINAMQQPLSQPVSDLASPTKPRNAIPLPFQIDFPRFDGSSNPLHWMDIQGGTIL